MPEGRIVTLEVRIPDAVPVPVTEAFLESIRGADARALAEDLEFQRGLAAATSRSARRVLDAAGVPESATVECGKDETHTSVRVSKLVEERDRYRDLSMAQERCAREALALLSGGAYATSTADAGGAPAPNGVFALLDRWARVHGVPQPDPKAVGAERAAKEDFAALVEFSGLHAMDAADAAIYWGCIVSNAELYQTIAEQAADE